MKTVSLSQDAYKALDLLSAIYRLPDSQILEIVLILAADRAVEALHREVDDLLRRHPNTAGIEAPTLETPPDEYEWP